MIVTAWLLVNPGLSPLFSCGCRERDRRRGERKGREKARETRETCFPKRR